MEESLKSMSVMSPLFLECDVQERCNGSFISAMTT